MTYDVEFYIRQAQAAINDISTTENDDGTLHPKKLSRKEVLAVGEIYAMMAVARAISKSNLFVQVVDQ